METIVVVILLQGIVFGAFSSFIAKEKNRDSAVWFILGFFFSLIALLALVAVPKLEKSSQNLNKNKPKPEWYTKPTPSISKKQKALRLFLIFLGLVAFILFAFIINEIS